MSAASHSGPFVVVGVDGSAAATRAVLFAAEEARRRGLPLRMLSVIDPAEHSSGQDDAQRVAAAEAMLQQARSAAVAAAPGLPTETAVVRGEPVTTLRRESRSAALLCAGVRGLHHFADGHAGSTATALARSAHCPVAVINDRGRARPDRPGYPGYVVAEADESVQPLTALDTVLELAVEAAVQRGAPLRVLTCCDPPTGLERRLDRWRHAHPDLDLAAVVLHEPVAGYLSRHAADIALAITARAALSGAADSVLIANPRRM